MARPSTAELLAAWERGLELPPSDRCLPLLAAADPAASPDDVASLPVGERDARLLELREWAFGSAMEGAARCPACGAELELPVDAAALRAAAGRGAGARESAVDAGGYTVRFRLPDSADMRAAAEAGTVEQARSVLLRRCVSGAAQDGVVVAVDALPDAVVERVEAAMAERGAQADVRIALTCPDCEHSWDAEFDVGLFLWREVDQWARRLLVEVAALASAYGWTESEVLALGPARREAYLELAAR